MPKISGQKYTFCTLVTTTVLTFWSEMQWAEKGVTVATQYKLKPAPSFRYHIFEILEYAWVNNFNIHKLSLEVRNREEDTTVLFTRFIKLILNDANFLMDEALHGLDEVNIYIRIT